MSALSKLKKLLTGSAGLYDRYVNIKLSSSKTKRSVSIATPKSGRKPNIAVQMRTNPSDMVSQFTISIMNCSLGINLSQFDTITVVMGYYSSLESFAFTGEILQIFQESPNPNGVITMQGNVGFTTAYSSAATLSVTFPPAALPAVVIIQNVVSQINAALSKINKSAVLVLDVTSMPIQWQSVVINLAGSTEQFTNVYEAVSWLNSLFISYVYSKDNTVSAPPIHLTINGKRLVVSSTVAGPSVPVLPLLSTVSSISVSGIHVSITCPFVPTIKANTCFYLAAQNFSAMLNVNGISELGFMSLIKANYTEVKFATVGTNQMLIDGIKLDPGKVIGKELQ